MVDVLGIKEGDFVFKGFDFGTYVLQGIQGLFPAKGLQAGFHIAVQGRREGAVIPSAYALDFLLFADSIPYIGVYKELVSGFSGTFHVGIFIDFYHSSLEWTIIRGCGGKTLF